MKWNIEKLFIPEGSAEILPDGVACHGIQGYHDFFLTGSVFSFRITNTTEVRERVMLYRRCLRERVRLKPVSSIIFPQFSSFYITAREQTRTNFLFNISVSSLRVPLLFFTPVFQPLEMVLSCLENLKRTSRLNVNVQRYERAMDFSDI